MLGADATVTRLLLQLAARRPAASLGAFGMGAVVSAGHLRGAQTDERRAAFIACAGGRHCRSTIEPQRWYFASNGRSNVALFNIGILGRRSCRRRLRGGSVNLTDIASKTALNFRRHCAGFAAAQDLAAEYHRIARTMKPRQSRRSKCGCR